MDGVLAVVLAGGKGTRLEPLTRDRAKPAVPFGALPDHRLTLSNCLNSGFRKILVLTQYKALSLGRHINRGWRGLCSWGLGGVRRYRAAAAAHRRALVSRDGRRRLSEHLHHREGAARIRGHPRRGSRLQDELPRDGRVATSGKEPTSPSAYSACRSQTARHRQFGVIQIDPAVRDRRVRGKAGGAHGRSPATRKLPYASMGIYVFTARFLFEQLCQNATRPTRFARFRRRRNPRQ